MRVGPRMFLPCHEMPIQTTNTSAPFHTKPPAANVHIYPYARSHLPLLPGGVERGILHLLIVRAQLYKNVEQLVLYFPREPSAISIDLIVAIRCISL